MQIIFCSYKKYSNENILFIVIQYQFYVSVIPLYTYLSLNYAKFEFRYNILY